MAVLLFGLAKLLQVMHPTIHVERSVGHLLRCKVKIDLLQLLKYSSVMTELELEVRANIHCPVTKLGVIFVAERILAGSFHGVL